MKKIIILALGIMGYFQSFGQNAEVVNAFNYQKNKEYAKAKTAIDKAALNAETAVKPKTWFYRGNIYMDITESQDTLIYRLDPDALVKTYESYTKAIELDLKKQYYNDIINRLKYVQNRFANNAIGNYKDKDFASAMMNFEASVAIGEKFFSKIDTSLIYNAAIAAQNAKLVAKQKELLARLISLKYPEPEIYRSLAGVYFAEKDTTKGLEYISLGRAAYPNYNALTIDELNVYMSRGQSKQMIEKMEYAAAADSTNKTLYFALGVTYDNLNKKSNAEKAYLKAIAIDSNYFDALYNLGAMHYNTAVEIFNKTNDLPMSKEKEYNAGKLKYTNLFNKSLPFLERANKLAPNDMNTLISLKEVYAKTNNFNKVAEIKKRIESLKVKKK
jgi:Tfp pilus assembly protein PilF